MSPPEAIASYDALRGESSPQRDHLPMLRSPESREEAAHAAQLEAGAARANNSLLKRALDLLGACAGLMALAPFLLLVALLIRLESRGPALFRQRRTGRN